MQALLMLLNTLLELYKWAFIVSAILSWLIAFNVLNTYNRAVYVVGEFLNRITEPMLRPIRQFLPNLGGIDIAPIVAILLIVFAQNLLFEYWPRF